MDSIGWNIRRELFMYCSDFVFIFAFIVLFSDCDWLFAKCNNTITKIKSFSSVVGIQYKQQFGDLKMLLLVKCERNSIIPAFISLCVSLCLLDASKLKYISYWSGRIINRVDSSTTSSIKFKFWILINSFGGWWLSKILNNLNWWNDYGLLC